MNLQQAISQLPQPVGATTMIDAMLSGDFSSVSMDDADYKTTIHDAETKLAAVIKAQNECKSDSAYWGYMGQISYWRSVINLLKAAEKAGPESLPNIPYPFWWIR